jgi:two-component system chemotaxis sensor kinase CheA
VPLSVVARLEEFPLSRIERASGRLVTQYRGQILPLVHVTRVTDPGSPITNQATDPMQVVVFADGSHMVGAIVDQVVDIEDDVVTIRQQTTQTGIVGSAVVSQKVTDFLDVQAVIAAARQDWFAHGPRTQAPSTVMLAEQSAFMRGLLRTHLEMAGHLVVEASTEGEAMECLDHTNVDLVVADMDMAAEGATNLLRRMKNSSRLASIPALGLGSQTDGTTPATDLHFDEYLARNDSPALLDAIARMIDTAHATDAVPELAGSRS